MGDTSDGQILEWGGGGDKAARVQAPRKRVEKKAWACPLNPRKVAQRAPCMTNATPRHPTPDTGPQKFTLNVIHGLSGREGESHGCTEGSKGQGATEGGETHTDNPRLEMVLYTRCTFGLSRRGWLPAHRPFVAPRTARGVSTPCTDFCPATSLGVASHTISVG
jgi:hypothetical protein